MNPSDINPELEGVAVIGMSGRFPGADNTTDLWKNLKEGKCSITKYTDEELLQAGVEKSILENPHYVKTSSHIQGIDLFDAEFFGYTPREAECMDPQHRLFMECAWKTFEDAGYNPETYNGYIGVFGGCGISNYLIKNISSNPELIETLGDFQIMLGNNNDYFTTRISYKLNLKGPSLNVQTACSTSLVAICLGYQSLITYQCDMALCGGSSLKIPTRQGYMYKEGFIFSPDGYCRAFDEKANGTVQGEGAAAVLLKRLDEAINDRDHIYAVIRGAALNNDGSIKVGYTAPSVDGQAQVIALAQELAGISPETITYIETHGTGTPLGDPIEIAALTKAFRLKTDNKNFCAIGSLKSNIGHLDAAAGVSGFIKTALAIKNRQLPPSINFSNPNPKLNIEESPFYINTKLNEWKTNSIPLRAGVSSFGIGGTNSHVILEEAPGQSVSSDIEGWKILLLSAKTDNSLSAIKINLANYFKNNPDINLSDAAYTLHVGRKLFDKRLALIARNCEDVIKQIETGGSSYTLPCNESRVEQPVVFMFTGQGSQYQGMTKDLYNEDPLFKCEIDTCAELLQPHIGLDIRSILYPADNLTKISDEEFSNTGIVQPLLFSVEYSLAQLWIKCGIKPDALIGHSLGEYVAACIAGVMSLEDALRIVAFRGKLIQSLPAGSMLSVMAAHDKIRKYLNDELSIAVVNGPELCVISGNSTAIKNLETILNENNITCSMLKTSHAFHSGMMEPACKPFLEEIKKIKLYPPALKYISNVSGTWITPDEAVKPEYWIQHLRETVKFSAGFETLVYDGYRIFLEVGPENTLCSITKRISSTIQNTGEIYRIPSLSHPLNRNNDTESMTRALAKILIAGASVNINSLYQKEKRFRIPMPTYAFDKKKFWIEQNTTRIKRCSEFNRNLNSHEATIENSLNNISSSADKDNIDQIMMEIWSEILGYKNIQMSDNFFDLGGDSFKATQLVSLINKRMNTNLTLADLFIDPTISGLSKFIKDAQSRKLKIENKNQDTSKFPVLFPIQPKGSNPPLFIVAGAHENRYFDSTKMKSSYEEDFLRYLSQIIPHLGMDQPVYGFRPKGLVADETPHRSVEEMADAYIKKIQSFLPTGPYLLAGECIGGVVAYEMAQQLHASGNQVANLILMDTHCPSFIFEYTQRYLVLRRKAVRIIKKRIYTLFNQGIRKFIDSIKHDLHLFIIIFAPVTKTLRTMRQISLRSHNYQNTLLKYRPKPYPGEITLIVNEEWKNKYPEMGWKDNLKTNMTVITVPGDHLTRLTTYGEITGKHLREIIKKTWDKYR